MSITVLHTVGPLSVLTFTPSMCLLTVDVGRSSAGVCMLDSDHGDAHVLTMVYEGQRNVWLAGASPRYGA